MRFGFILISALFYYIFDGISESNRYVSQEKKTLQASISDGKETYQEFCVTCHLSNGKGTPGTVPPLAGSDWLSNKRKESIHAVKYGQSGPIVVNGKNYNNTMPPMGLTDEEVADVMNYVMNSWENKQKKQVTNGEVFAIKK
jgi:mono/diheme cytochrome c family protein